MLEVMKVPRADGLLILLQPSGSSSFQDYQRMLDLIRDIILATDLAHHLRIFKDLQKMADGTIQQGLVSHVLTD